MGDIRNQSLYSFFLTKTVFFFFRNTFPAFANCVPVLPQRLSSNSSSMFHSFPVTIASRASSTFQQTTSLLFYPVIFHNNTSTAANKIIIMIYISQSIDTPSRIHLKYICDSHLRSFLSGDLCLLPMRVCPQTVLHYPITVPITDHKSGAAPGS